MGTGIILNCPVIRMQAFLPGSDLTYSPPDPVPTLMADILLIKCIFNRPGERTISLTYLYSQI
jgi:hypothetical protein